MADRRHKAPPHLQVRLKKIHIFNHLEIQRLFAVITDLRDKALFLIAYRHGLRASEVSSLQTTDVDLLRPTLAIRRVGGGRHGDHALQKDEKVALAHYLKSRADSSLILFVTDRGRAISRRGLDWLIKSYGELAKLPKAKQHFHTLKHSLAAHLLGAGSDLLSVHHWLGLNALPNTAVYLYLAPFAAEDKAAYRKLLGPDRFRGLN